MVNVPWCHECGEPMCGDARTCEHSLRRKLRAVQPMKASEILPGCMMPDGAEPCRAYAELRAELGILRALLSAYVADENRYNRGDGEPFGTISTELGMRARAAVNT